MKNTKRAGIVSASAATLIVGGIAFAAWTSTGTATGTVTSGTQTGLTVTSETVSGLYPTVDKTFTVTVKNTNPYAVQMRSLLRTANANPAACLVSFTEQTGLSDVLAADDGTKIYTLTASMGKDSDGSKCQGVDFVQEYQATADSNVP